jgi:hypothetical protein
MKTLMALPSDVRCLAEVKLVRVGINDRDVFALLPWRQESLGYRKYSGRLAR